MKSRTSMPSCQGPLANERHALSWATSGPCSGLLVSTVVMAIALHSLNSPSWGDRRRCSDVFDATSRGVQIHGTFDLRRRSHCTFGVRALVRTGLKTGHDREYVTGDVTGPQTEILEDLGPARVLDEAQRDAERMHE